MGTIVSRRRKDGSAGHTAQIRIKRDGKIVFSEAQTFDRKPAAAAWLKKRETELAQPGAIEMAGCDDPLLSEVIDRFLKESVKKMGRSKVACLNMIKAHRIGSLKCSQITSDAISSLAVEFSQRTAPQTVSTYISHLAAVLAVAKPLWKCPIKMDAMEQAKAALEKMGVIGRSRRRTRRPTLDELDKLMKHFDVVQRRRGTNNMQKVIAFAIFSTRRQDEICRIVWSDLDETGSRVLVRDMKDPDKKEGNDVWCELPPEAMNIIKSMPRVSDQIFPYNADAVSAAFTRACSFLRIPDLRFHDLRHDGISRLFEMGKNIPQAACVSGHRSWSSLQRYTHIRQTGDKYAGWEWLSLVTAEVAGTP
jgi:integrase